jgi:cytochrome c biogenesis factor
MQIDWHLVGTVSAATACYLAVAIPSGRLIERHCNEPLMKWIWRGVLALFAVGAFLSFYGVGETVTAAGRRAVEQKRASTQYVAPDQPDSK